MKSASDLSHWIDESMPDGVRDLLFKAKIDVDQFQERIGPVVGNYRSGEHIKINIPQPSEEEEFVLRLCDLVGALEEKMRPGVIPVRSHSMLLATMHLRLGEDWNSMQERVLRDLQIMQAVLPIIAKKLRTTQTKRGPKNKQNRNALLQKIEAELRRQLSCLKKVSSRLALEILAAYGIAAPSPDKKSPEKSVTRATKKRA